MQTRPTQLGITGGIGSGKSLVCRIFACLGVPVYDADSHAKELMTTDGILISEIKKEFGDLSYHSDGTLNRQFISERVFGDEERLKTLNTLVHPRVAADYKHWLSMHADAHYVLKEAALLVETGGYVELDKLIVVSAPESLRVARVLKRDTHRTAEQIKEIMKSQMSEEEKISKADFIVMNDESKLVIPQIISIHKNFIA